MFIHQIHAVRYTATSKLGGTATLSGEGTSVQVTFTDAELAQLEAVAEAAYNRHLKDLMAELSKPLETNLLAAPAPTLIADADFDEVL